MIVLKDVSKTFGKLTALSGVSFRIDPKEFVCITGPSGSGKSTLLALIIGAEEPTKGRVEIDGVDLRSVPEPALQFFRRRVGVMFQDYRLIQNRTVAENIAFPLEVCGISDRHIGKRVPELLTRMGLQHRAKALPRELSGGEQARTAIARAIAHSPLVLLADEPTGDLDPEESLELLRLLQEIHAEGTTIVLATHDAVIVDKLKTRVIRLERGTLIRDSVGSYEHESRKHREEPSHGKHKLFTEPLAEAAPSEHQSPAKNGHRKVKVTAIGS